MAPPAILPQITMTTGNNTLDWHYNGSDQQTSVAAGTYTSINLVLSTLQTNMRAEGGAPASLTCSLTGASGTGVVQVVINSAETNVFKLYHTTSTISSLLGYSTAADDTGAYTYTADYQSPYIWAAARSPVKAGPVTSEHVGSPLRTSLDGKSSTRLSVGFIHSYDLVLAELVPELMWAADATSTNTNRDLEGIWEVLCGGVPAYVFEDRANLATIGSATLRGYLTDPDSLAEAVTRPHMDYESYNVTLRFRKLET